MTKLMFRKVLMLIRQVHLKVYCFPLLVFFGGGFKIQAAACNGCNVYYYCVYWHSVLMSIDLNSITVLNIYGVNYCFINGISRREAIHLLKTLKTLIQVNKVEYYRI